MDNSKNSGISEEYICDDSIYMSRAALWIGYDLCRMMSLKSISRNRENRNNGSYHQSVNGRWYFYTHLPARSGVKQSA